MGSPEQIKRWAADWAASTPALGCKIEAIKFEEKGGKERVSISLFNGQKLTFQAEGGKIRAYVRCCGKPDQGPAACS